MAGTQVGSLTINSSSTKPTYTRALLRRMIGIELGMPFYRRYGTGYNVFTTGSISAPKDTSLEKTADIWNNQWLWITTTGAGDQELRKIMDYSSDNVFSLDANMTANPAGGLTNYEILSVFTPHEIHQAINMAIESAYPEFFDVVMDSSIIVCRDQTEYSLTGLVNPIRTPIKVWLERNSAAIDGVVDTHDNTYITDADADFSGVEAGWLISLYYGDGLGDLRTVSSVSGTQVNVSAAWSVHPENSVTRYKLWDPNYQLQDWYASSAVRFDIREGPTVVSFGDNLNQFEGMRIRLQYVTNPLRMTDDSSTTFVPAEYIISYAIAHLAATRMNDNKSDRSRYQMLYETHSNSAQQYKRFNAWRHPPTQLLMEQDPGIIRTSSTYSPF